jgi:dihydrofolate synthase/folylpolyglutamate synthase
VQNAQVAITLAKLAGLGEDAIARGLREASWPGRFERLTTPQGPVVLDGAHNVDGMRALVATLTEERLAPAAVVFGAMADKDYRLMLKLLAGAGGRRVYVEPAGRAPAACEELNRLFPGESSVGVTEALRRARELAGPEGLVLVTGSLYLVGEARAVLLGLPRDPPIAL